jgi:UDP:flavonoid glycosyltransferase YjiC (YdhE family)
MRLLFTLNPQLGHLHPLVPFARAAQRRGHDVLFATAARFGPTVERAGFSVAPAGLPDDALPIEHFPEMRTLPPQEREDYVWRHYYAERRAGAMVRDLLALAEVWRPDVLVREENELGGWLAAEALGMPHATVQVGSYRPGLAAVITEPLNQLRAAYGLPPDPDLASLYRYLYLVTIPPSLGDPAISLVPTARAVQPVAFDQYGTEQLPSWIDDLPPEPTVYLTLGTVFNGRLDVFDAFVRGLADLPLNLIVTVGHSGDPANLDPLPPNVRVERYIPQTLVLPRCAAVICHGGSGTLLAALGHGLPLVLVPFTAGQPENAARCAAAGVTRVLSPGALSPEAARDAVLDVLSEPSYRRNAAHVRDEIATLPDIDAAVALLEHVALGRTPPAAS